MKLRLAAFIPIAAILLSANAELTYDYKMTVEKFYGTYDYLCSFITSELTNATDTVALSDLEIASIANLYTSRNVWEYSEGSTGKNLAISSGELSFATTTTASRASWLYSSDAFHNEEFGVKIVPPAGYVSYGFLYTVFSSNASENKLLSNTNKLTIDQIKNTGYPQYHIVPLIRPARKFWFVDPVANTTNVIAAAGTEEEGDDGPIGVKLPTPKAKRGYEFQYWETESGSSLQGKEYYNPSFTLGSASTPVIVKAKFKQLPWTITFNANGGTGTMAAQEYYQGNSFTLKANAFTKTGYSFGGWALYATGGKVYDNNASIAANDENMTTNKTLYAKWAANNYSLILYANNGTAASSSKAMVYDTAASITKFDSLGFSKTGYSFAGWGTQATSTTIDYADEAVVSNLVTTAGGSIGLYCVWTANVYTVTFNNGSGSGGTASVNATYGSAMPSIDTLPTRTGYTLEGYYTSTYGAGTRYYYATGSSAKKWDKTVDTTLYANWSANKYTVTLNKQGGSDGPDSVTATYNSELPKVTTPTRTGYTFGGYFTGENGGTQYYSSAGASVRNWTLTYNTTLYAKWTAKTSTVTFDQQDGSGGTASVDATYDRVMPSITIPTRTGYTFGGYFANTGGYGTQYYNADGTSTRTWDKTDTSITLYANWTAKTYTVTLDQQGGSGGTESVTATYASSMPTATMPTRDGYAFGGYYMEANGGGDQYYRDNGASAQAWNLTSGTTLYAKWGEIKYTLKLWPNGGTGSSVSTNLTYDEEYTLPTAATLGYTKTGYRFNGWGDAYDSTTALYADGATVSNLTSSANTTVNLYAIWGERTYTVTFDANGGEIDDGDSTREYTYNSTYGSLPVPSRTGYTFTGWKNGDNSITGDMTCNLTDDATFTASWTPINYVIAFDANGGTGEMDAIDAEYDEEVTLPASTFESPGKLLSFAGWSETVTDPETPDVEIAYADKAVVSNLVTEAGATNTLYAVWRYPDMNYALENFDLEFEVPNAYTDKVDVNTEDCFVEATNGGRFTTILTNAEGTLSFNWDTTGSGYVQITPYLPPGGTGPGNSSTNSIVYYPDAGEYAISLSTNKAVNVFWRADSGAGKTIKVSKVKWTANAYTVMLDQQGGSGGTSSVAATYDSAMPSAEMPTRTGYTFGGYYDATSGGTKYYNADGTSAKTWDRSEAATLYARWTPINYVIAFDANGGTGEMDAIDAEYDEEVTLPASTFESPGKLLSFAGWSESATAPETLDVEIAYADQAVVSNLVTEAGATNTLYAVWRYPDMNYALENFDLEFEVPNAYTDKVTINTEDCFVEATDGGRFTTIITNAEGTLSFNWDTTGSGRVQIFTYSSDSVTQTIINNYTPNAGEYAIALSTNIAVKVFWRSNDGTIKVSQVKWTPAGDEPTPAGDEPTDDDAPDISSLSVADGVKFTSDARFKYEIWYKTDLSSKTDWKLLTTIEGTGGEVGFDLIQPGEDVMFYEIKVVVK